LLFKPVRFVGPFIRTNYWVNGRTLIIKRPFQKPFSIQMDHLDEIGIETTDQGPFIEDIFWIIKRGKLRLRIGEPHPNFKILMDRFGSLEGFDWEPFIEAMACTDNHYFMCWKRLPLHRPCLDTP
jgi:hypothetical protein